MKSRCLAALAAVLLIAGCGQSHPSQSAAGSVHPPGWGTVGPPRSFGLTPTGSATAVMFDTTTLGTVPSHPFALAGYTAGNWPTFFPLRREYPSAHTISIAISTRYHADCLDVEQWDATPGEVPGWVRSEIKAGWRKPCIYSDWYEFTHQIWPVLERAGIKRSQVWEWDANYAGCPRLDPGFDATQCTDHAYGRNLDESIVTRAFLSIAHPALIESHPKPKPAPKPKPIPRPKPKPRHKPVDPRLKHLYAYRTHLRKVLVEQHCRVKHPDRHCRGVLHSGDVVNRQIRKLGGR